MYTCTDLFLLTCSDCLYNVVYVLGRCLDVYIIKHELPYICVNGWRGSI